MSILFHRTGVLAKNVLVLYIYIYMCVCMYVSLNIMVQTILFVSHPVRIQY